MEKKIEKKSFISEIILSLLFPLNCLYKEEYLSSSVNVLRKKSEVLHSTNKDFFQLNYVHRDQQIW